MYEEIKNLIRQKSSNIDEQTLMYFTNYFYVLKKSDLLPNNVLFDELIENALVYASKIEFYDENHRIYLKNGKDTKGLREPETKTIFIRDNLEEPLREITIYHELHHAVQTNPENDQVGINQVSNIGRLIMEAQTQYFAEKVYSEIHSVDFEERQIPSEELRMADNGIVVSKLHNYEMYDNFLSKLSIILDVSKEYFVSINYLYKNNEGLKDLEMKYNVAKEKYNIPYDFDKMLLMFDYIYCVDLLAYIENPDKQIILNGQETEFGYEIYPDKYFKLSLSSQRTYLNNFDVNCFLALAQNGGNFRDFATYVVDNEKRELIHQFLKSFEQPTQPGTSEPPSRY